MAAIEVEVEVDRQREDSVDLLASAANLPKGRIKDAMQKGAVWIIRRSGQRRLRRVRARLNVGDRLRLCYDPAILAQSSPVPTLIHDAEQYSIWCKPRMMLSSGSRFGDHCAMARWIEMHQQIERPVFLVHRLDRAATGLMVFAHKKTVAASLSRAFQQRQIDKHYRVTVAGKTHESGTIDLELDGKDAVSHFRIITYDAETRQTTLDVKIETGRKHQIRRHLSAIGHPVIGDRLYGEAGSEPLALISYSLAFTCPISGEPVQFTLPAELAC
jgi:tRNA pseudouridine32 synthase/23S rRNA pseudouridine746 synthase